MKVVLITISMVCCAFLGGCSSTPKDIDSTPIIEGRPTQAQCVERQDRALELQDWMRNYPKDMEAINAVKDEIETVLFNDGCIWLYGTTERLEAYHLLRVKMQEDLLRDYADVLKDFDYQHGFLIDVLAGKVDIETQRAVLEQLGGRDFHQGEAYIAQTGPKDLH